VRNVSRMNGLGGAGENGEENGEENENQNAPLIQQPNIDQDGKKRLTVGRKWRLCLRYALVKGRGVQHMSSAKLKVCQIVDRAPTTVKRIRKEFNDQSYLPFDQDINLDPKFKGNCGLARRPDVAEVEVSIKGIIRETGGYITYKMIEKRLHRIQSLSKYHSQLLHALADERSFKFHSSPFVRGKQDETIVLGSVIHFFEQ
jgi:hypothetical protein